MTKSKNGKILKSFLLIEPNKESTDSGKKNIKKTSRFSQPKYLAMTIKKQNKIQHILGRKCTGSSIDKSIFAKLTLATPQLKTCFTNCFNELLLR